VTETDEGWSTPSLYAGGRALEPRTFTENDPISALVMADWAGPSADGARWSAPTYVGRRRLRPDTRPAAETIDAHAPSTPAEPEPAGERMGDEDEQGNRRLLANSTTMAVATLVSRITGFLRTIVLAAALGTGAVANSYNSGNTFPNMVYELLLGGVLTSVLVPLLVHAQETDSDDGLAYTQRLLSIAAALLGVMTLVAVACAPWLAGAFAKQGQQELTNIFATLLLPEIFFYGLGAMFMAVLNIRNVYGPGAWAPLLNNVIVILSVCVFWALPGPATLNPSTMTNAQILVLGIGTTLGIAAQALVLVPSLRRAGFRWHWRFRARPNEVGRLREVGRLAGWVLGYVVASQVGVSVILWAGNRNGGLTVFTYVDLLFQMPYGILVVSLLTAVMPRMSRAAVRGEFPTVVADLRLCGRLSAVALVPVTAGLIVLGVPLAVTLFGHGQTSIADAQLLGSSLALSAFGLFPFALVMLQLRVFYAMRDGKTPTVINIFMVAAKIVLVLVMNAVFAAPAGTDVDLHPSVHAVEWLNISTSLSYVLGAIVGHVLLTRRLGRLGFSQVVRTVVRIAIPSVAGAVAAYAVVRACHSAFGPAHAGSLSGLLLGTVAGVLVLTVLLWRMRIPEVREIGRMVRGR
jgi:putative peptidoglycan lipid II flippase